MSSSQPLVTIATPFYNAAPYFQQCIESVLAQSYQNFEYILLDNMSTDGSGDLAREYARRDPRLRVIRNEEFLSLTQNHNAVLRLISPASRYCKVLQADDWLFPNCLVEMVRVAEAQPSIGVVSAYTLLERSVYLTGLPYPSEFIPGREIARRLLLEGLNVFGSPTATLIRADLIRARDPFYDQRSPIDDLDVCLELMQSSDFGFVNQVLTFTRRDNVSTITTLKRYGISTLTQVMIVNRFGPKFLDAAELRDRKREVEQDEYNVLAEGFVNRQPKGFWEFHRSGLWLAGLRISRTRVAWRVLAYVINWLFNPKATADKLLARGRRGAD
jgi:glycosyltransferase involved in cell wall biosynthesis